MRTCAWQAGGAVFQNDAASSISFCIFSNNSAGAGAGGAVYRNACQGFTINCSFLGNTAAQGGAIYQNNCVSNNIRCAEGCHLSRTFSQPPPSKSVSWM
jgi:predicted outer membrane repeat protein